MDDRIPLPMPIGWYCIAFSDDVTPGDVRNVHYFDRDMVLFRTDSGALGLTSPICPHLGAHLGHGGSVVGETIQCPFHHWRYDTDGVIADIPYARRIPPKVAGRQCLQTFPVCERNNVIWAWYHPDNSAPAYEVIDIPECSDPAWSSEKRFTWVFDSHPQEIAENGVDVAHFRYIHQMEAVPLGETTYDGHVRHSVVRGPRTVVNERGEKETIEYAVEVVQNGAGQKWTRMSGLVDYLLQVLVTPINPNTVEVRFAYVHEAFPPDSFQAKAMAEAIQNTNGQRGLEGDIPIWQNKHHLRSPLLCDGDGPIMQFRKYFAQFYPAGQSYPRDELADTPQAV